MARRRPEEHHNHEAWAIPYGDLVTLLMAFFVVMYSVSVVDAGKYRVLSDSLVDAFGAPGRLAPIRIGEPAPGADVIAEGPDQSLVRLDLPGGLPEPAVPELAVLDPPSPETVAVETAVGSYSEAERLGILREIGEVGDEIEGSLGSLMEDELIKVERASYWLEIEINTSLLFPSGSAILEPGALPVLAEVARILAKRDARVHVEGHTDDLPIRSSLYPSNWELSSGRAATVVNLFAENGVDPERMAAIGYGEYRPIASNATAEGRAENRRVAVVVMPGPPPRAARALEPEQLRPEGRRSVEAEPRRQTPAAAATGVSPTQAPGTERPATRIPNVPTPGPLGRPTTGPQASGDTGPADAEPRPRGLGQL